MKWSTCDDCLPVLDRLLALWVRGGNAGGLEAVRIQMEREQLARWLKEHRRKMHAPVPARDGASSARTLPDSE